MDIIEAYYNEKNVEKSIKMTAYMKNKFPFLGIQKPDRTKLNKEFLKERKKDTKIDWDFIFQCYSLPEREFHYLALEYIATVKKLLVMEDISYLEELITKNSWWDSVDTISPIVGYLCEKYPELKEQVMKKWMESDNLWLNRVSIIFQLKYKKSTDTEFLSEAIVKNCNTNEFFRNKAIGWALREYSKTDKEWVRNFLENHKLSNLSVREASKYL